MLFPLKDLFLLDDDFRQKALVKLYKKSINIISTYLANILFVYLIRAIHTWYLYLDRVQLGSFYVLSALW